MPRRRSDDGESESSGLLAGSRGSSAEPVPAGSKGLMDRLRGRTSGSSSSSTGSESTLDRIRGRSTEPPKSDSGGRFSRARAKYGLGTLLVAAGVVLFLFPEPVTSTAGVVLMAAGVVLWLLG